MSKEINMITVTRRVTEAEFLEKYATSVNVGRWVDEHLPHGFRVSKCEGKRNDDGSWDVSVRIRGGK